MDHAVLADFIAGGDSPEAIELLRATLRQWMLGDGTVPLQRYLGLRSPSDFRRLERDRWLRAALAHAGTVTALAAAVLTFERNTWPSWRNGAIAPARATRLQADLFYARKASLDALPISSKQLRRIVATRDTESASDVHAIAA